MNPLKIKKWTGNILLASPLLITDFAIFDNPSFPGWEQGFALRLWPELPFRMAQYFNDPYQLIFYLPPGPGSS